MATISEKSIKDALRNKHIALFFEFLKSQGYEPMYTAAGTLYYLDGERWIKLSAIIPNASEEEATDGYSLAEEYTMKLDEKAEKKAEADRKKAEKIAKDTAKREAKKKKEEAE